MFASKMCSFRHQMNIIRKFNICRNLMKMGAPVVRISDGEIKGRIMTDYDGNKMYAFLGIPYAKPPYGDLRFKAPVPIDPWEGVRDASVDGDKCIQKCPALEGSENCIHLNVFTKEKHEGPTDVYAPVIEEPNDTAVITNDPDQLVSSGKYNNVPIIMGYTSAEAMYFTVNQMMKEARGLKYPTKYRNLEEVLPSKIRKKASTETIKRLCEKLEKVYEKYPKVQMWSDAHTIEGIIRAAKLHIQVSLAPLYFYRMDIDDELNYYKKMVPGLKLPGMCHADDIGYLFTTRSLPLAKKGSSAEIAVRRIVKLWTNFAKYGTPTPDEKEFNLLWNPISTEHFNFLEIGPQLKILADPESDRMKFWEEVMEIVQNNQ